MTETVSVDKYKFRINFVIQSCAYVSATDLEDAELQARALVNTNGGMKNRTLQSIEKCELITE